MELRERIRGFFMSARMVSREELLERLEEAEAGLANAAAEREAEEEAQAALGVSGPVDEVSLARAGKRLSDLRAREARWQEQVQRCEVALRVAAEKASEAEQQAAFEATRAALRVRYQKGAELHDAALALAKAFVGYCESCEAAARTFPRPSRQMLAFMHQVGTQRAIELALYGQTERLWMPRNAGLETPQTARARRTFAEQVQSENELLESEFDPSRPVPPRAA